MAGITCWSKLEITPPSFSNHSRYGTGAGHPPAKSAEVIRLADEGMTREAIAAQLGIASRRSIGRSPEAAQKLADRHGGPKRAPRGVKAVQSHPCGAKDYCRSFAKRLIAFVLLLAVVLARLYGAGGLRPSLGRSNPAERFNSGLRQRAYNAAAGGEARERTS